jgi:hypothetical protein
MDVWGGCGLRGNAVLMVQPVRMCLASAPAQCCLAWGDNEAGERAGVAADDADDSKTLAGHKALVLLSYRQL